MAQFLYAPLHTALDADGLPINAATARFYLTGTTTPADVYHDADLGTPWNQSTGIPADSAGRFPTIYLDPAITYKMVYKDAAGVTVKTFDPVNSVLGATDFTFLQAGTGAESRSGQDKLREIVSVLDYAATDRVDGTTDDTNAFVKAFAASDFVKAPGGHTYRVDNIEVGEGQNLLTDGFSTVFFQNSGTGGTTTIISVTGANASVGSCKLKGNISTDSGEFHHGIAVYNTGADVTDVVIGDLYGEDIRGDVLYIGDVIAHPLRRVTFGDVYGTNVLRNVVSIVGGQGIRGGHIAGGAVGYRILDIEPEGTTNPARDVDIASVWGGVCQVAGTTAAAYAGGIRIGSIDLNPTRQANSTPTYGSYDVKVALWLRNIKHLRIGTFRATGHANYAISYIYNGGELTGARVVIDHIDLSSINTSGNGTTIPYYYCRVGNTKQFEVNGGSVTGLGNSRTFAEGNNATPANFNPKFKDLTCDGTICNDAGYALFDNCNLSNTNVYAAPRVSNSRFRGGVYNVTGLSYGATANVVEGADITLSGNLFHSFGPTASEYNHVIHASTIGGVYTHFGAYKQQYQSPLRFGPLYLWADANNQLRLKASAPASDTDGSIVGPDQVTTVASLTAASAANTGARAFVTDSNATLAAGIGNTVAGGGANKVPVYSDGSNWKIG